MNNPLERCSGKLLLLPPAIVALVVVVLSTVARAAETDDPLPSWNDTPTKQAILSFVHSATEKDSPGFVPVEHRIATFDNDGTLWVEKPMYTQVVFALERAAELSADRPDLRTQQPFATLLQGDREAMSRFTTADLRKILMATHSGESVHAYQAVVRRWLATARHPRFKRPYTECVYQPMLELLRYLRSVNFKTYIVTGGGQGFVRVFADPVYGVPPQQVVGSMGKLAYQRGEDGRPELAMLPETLLVDDGPGKPVGIHLVIGRRPVAAFGNSVGDREMLEWTQAGTSADDPSARLMLLVHHDDARREYAYGPDSKVGTFPAELMDEARQRGWLVVSMKNDWKRIFAFEE